MTFLAEVVQEKIALMVIVSFFTFMGLEMTRIADDQIILAVLGSFFVLVSGVLELLIVAWIFFSIRKWKEERLAWKKKHEKTKESTIERPVF